MSDLLFIRSHPYLCEGDPHKLLAVLEELLALDVNTYVPGHGPIGTREDVLKMVDYVKFCIDTAEDYAHTGSSLEDLLKMAIPEKFRDWHMLQMFPGNLESIYQKKRDPLGLSVKE
jgi:glyoxylase-like metal-dependent hydrolase (beta-lactamase superfamily II)